MNHLSRRAFGLTPNPLVTPHIGGSGLTLIGTVLRRLVVVTMAIAVALAVQACGGWQDKDGDVQQVTVKVRGWSTCSLLRDYYLDLQDATFEVRQACIGGPVLSSMALSQEQVANARANLKAARIQTWVDEYTAPVTDQTDYKIDVVYSSGKTRAIHVYVDFPPHWDMFMKTFDDLGVDISEYQVCTGGSDCA